MYVDGFVLCVPSKNIPAYTKLARLAGKVWKEHGALDYVECVIEESDVQMGISFPALAKPKKGETVVFSWITYKSKTERNRILKKVMKDKRLADHCGGKDMPFDVKRMTYGGFKPIVQA